MSSSVVTIDGTFQSVRAVRELEEMFKVNGV